VKKPKRAILLVLVLVLLLENACRIEDENEDEDEDEPMRRVSTGQVGARENRTRSTFT